MRILLFFVVCYISIPINGSAQENFHPDLSRFSNEILTAAKFNDSNTVLTTEEKEVVFYLNLVRLDPQTFSEQIAKPYIEEVYPKGNRYTRSLITDLSKAQPANYLVFKSDLYQVSKSHAIDIGKHNIDGHTGSHGKTFQKRTNSIYKTYKGVGENLGFGYTSPIEIVMELLIDYDISNLGHRKTILDVRFTCVGVFIGPHSYYKTCCVMDFGMKKNVL